MSQFWIKGKDRLPVCAYDIETFQILTWAATDDNSFPIPRGNKNLRNKLWGVFVWCDKPATINTGYMRIEFAIMWAKVMVSGYGYCFIIFFPIILLAELIEYQPMHKMNTFRGRLYLPMVAESYKCLGYVFQFSLSLPSIRNISMIIQMLISELYWFSVNQME